MSFLGKGSTSLFCGKTASIQHADQVLILIDFFISSGKNPSLDTLFYPGFEPFQTSMALAISWGFFPLSQILGRALTCDAGGGVAADDQKTPSPSIGQQFFHWNFLAELVGLGQPVGTASERNQRVDHFSWCVPFWCLESATWGGHQCLSVPSVDAGLARWKIDRIQPAANSQAGHTGHTGFWSSSSSKRPDGHTGHTGHTGHRGTRPAKTVLLQRHQMSKDFQDLQYPVWSGIFFSFLRWEIFPVWEEFIKNNIGLWFGSLRKKLRGKI